MVADETEKLLPGRFGVVVYVMTRGNLFQSGQGVFQQAVGVPDPLAFAGGVVFLEVLAAGLVKVHEILRLLDLQVQESGRKLVVVFLIKEPFFLWHL